MPSCRRRASIAIPFFVGFAWAPDWRLALLFLAVPMFLNYFYLSPAVALVQEQVQPHERVLAGALLLLVMNLIGLGCGPTFLGAASDCSVPITRRTPCSWLSMPWCRSTCWPWSAFVWLARAIRQEAAGRR